MTELEYQTLKAGDKVEFDQHPWIQQCVIQKVDRDLVYLTSNTGGEQRYYPAYVRNSGRREQDWTPKPVPKEDAFEARCNDATLGRPEELYVDPTAYKALQAMSEKP